MHMLYNQNKSCVKYCQKHCFKNPLFSKKTHCFPTCALFYPIVLKPKIITAQWLLLFIFGLKWRTLLCSYTLCNTFHIFPIIKVDMHLRFQQLHKLFLITILDNTLLFSDLLNYWKIRSVAHHCVV